MATERTNDIRAFKSFIDEKLSNGGADLTLDDALSLWYIETQPDVVREANIKAVREALDDMRAGDTGIPADELMAPLRQKYGLL